jgi:DNA-binding MarR family transcriptional regulator
MDELHKILADHHSRSKLTHEDESVLNSTPVSSEDSLANIPDLFFDRILVDYKLTRMEILVLMHLYRQVWCRPNLYKMYGISQLLSYTEIAKIMNITLEEVYQALRKLEGYGFITTIRSGQYFVRKFFTKDLDEFNHQTYDDFEDF